MTHFADVLLIMIPGLLFSSVSALPLGLGILAAVRHLRTGARIPYLRNLVGSIVAGAVALLLLAGSLFGDDLSSSSTAGLIFVFAPIYSAAALGLAYGLSAAVLGKPKTTERIPLSSRRVLLVPVGMLLVLVGGLIKTSYEGNDLAMAERASKPETLTRLFEESRRGDADSFGVPLFLAQNANTPPELLAELARHNHPAVRVHVAQHLRTPASVVESLRNDCSSFVRNAVEERLGKTESNKALQPMHTPTGVC